MATAALVAYLLFLTVQVRPDPATFSLLALGLFALLGRQSVIPLLRSVDFMALGVFVAAMCISTVLSDDAGVSFRYLGYAAINGFILLLAATQRQDWQWQILAGCLALLGITHLMLLLIYGGNSDSSSPQALIDLQPLVTLQVPSDALIAGLCLPAMAFVASKAVAIGRRLSIFLLILYVAAGLYCSYLLESKVVFLSVTASLVALTLVHWGRPPPSRPTIWVALVISIAAGLLLTAWILGNQSTTRLGIWSHAITQTETVKEVLVGNGPNTFKYDPVFAENRFDEDSRVVPWAHNLFIEAWTEQGLLGLVGILLMTLIPIKRALALADNDRRLFLLSSALVFCLLALIELTLTRRFNFAFMCLLYGLSCVGERGQNGGKNQGEKMGLV